MKISIVTDEVSSDLETALEIIRAWNIDAVELRAVGAQRVPQISEYWKVRLPDLLQEFGLSVAAISPGLFQTVPPGRPAGDMLFSRRGDMQRVRREQEDEALREYHLTRLLPESIEAAKRLGARSIVCFSFARMDHTEGEYASDEVIQVLRYAADKVAAAGLMLNIEVSELTRRSADACRRANHAALGINWDPGNAFIGGEDDVFPGGFELARPWIRHVHFKDGRFNPVTGEREWVVDGILDWAGAFAALKQDGFDGYVSVETHVRPKIESSLRLLRRLRELIQGDAASAPEALAAFDAMPAREVLAHDHGRKGVMMQGDASAVVAADR
jgi:sugar phosphate isomerase/epimerase